MSEIEWCDKTWNPVIGCSIVSPGCTNCYAMAMARRVELSRMAPHYSGLTKAVNGKAVWTGKVMLAPSHILNAPLRWRTPRSIFVNSMGDLFHEAVPDEWIDRVFAVMALALQHKFIVLTKRAKRMRNYLSLADNIRSIQNQTIRIATSFDLPAWMVPAGDVGQVTAPDRPWVWPLPNVFLGVSAERQQEADERIPDLLATPAAKRVVSAEPLLGPIDFTNVDLGAERLDAFAGYRAMKNWHDDVFDSGKGLDAVIVGGESGPGARPMHPDWAREIRDQCAATDIPFFFKQHGEWIGELDLRQLPGGSGPGFGIYDHCPHDMEAEAVRVGKRAAGRLLDGREYNDLPWRAVTNG